MSSHAEQSCVWQSYVLCLMHGNAELKGVICEGVTGTRWVN